MVNIPKGIYCYDEGGLCKFWNKDETKPHQESGYCTLMNLKDWEHGTLLWDQVKECGLNDSLEDEEDF